MFEIVAVVAIVTPFAVLCTLAYMGFVTADRNGWKKLAARFRYRGKFDGAKLHLQSATLNGFAFPMTMVLGAGPEGLFLRPALPVRLFHAPLVLPWDALRSQPFRRLHSSGLRLTLRDAQAEGPDFELEIPAANHARLLHALDPAWDGARRVLDPTRDARGVADRGA